VKISRIAVQISLASVLTFAACPNAQVMASSPVAPCSAPIYHQFDFWLGDWTVTNAKNKVIGVDSVTRRLGGCVIYERYVDAGDKSVGIGLSGVQIGNATWHQTFMDDEGTVVTLDGRWHNGIMELRGKNFPAGRPLLSDGIWIPKNGVVEEVWKVSTDGGRTWKVRFDGFFHKRVSK
jgi:hypothetical protein